MTLKEEKSPANRRPFILLAEDSPDDAYFFQRALQRSGVECDLNHVSDGAAAVEILEKAVSGVSKMPEVLFLDLKMPVMTGFEVLEWLRDHPFASSPPVIVLSGSNQQADRERARELGASDYLVKPITREDLANRLKRFTDCAAVRA